MMAKERLHITTSARRISTIAVGFVLLAGTPTAMAGDAVRDHRAGNGAPQGGVTVDGKPTRVTTAQNPLGGANYKGFSGLIGPDYGKGRPKTGATMRDHR